MGGVHPARMSCISAIAFFTFLLSVYGAVSISCVSLQLGHKLLYFPIICAWSRGRFLVFPCTWAMAFFTFLLSVYGASIDFLCFLTARPRASLLSYYLCMEPKPISCVSLHLGHRLLYFHIIRVWGQCRFPAFPYSSATGFFTFLLSVHGAEADFLCFLAPGPLPSLLSYYPCMEPVSISCVSLQLGHGLLYFPIICAWSRGRFLMFPCTWVIGFFTFLLSVYGASVDFLRFLTARPRASLLSYYLCMEPRPISYVSLYLGHMLLHFPVIRAWSGCRFPVLPCTSATCSFTFV